MSLIGMIQDFSFIYLLQCVGFAFIAALPVQVFIIIGNNYPDKPIVGKQKRNFNRMFLVNAFLLTLLFGFVFYDIQDIFYPPDDIISIARLYEPPSLPDFILSCLMLIFQLVILFGMFWLRNTINLNTAREQFDFESSEKNV